MFRLLLALSLSAFAPCSQDLHIDLDPYDCIDQHPEMDMQVDIDSSTHRIEASCSVPLDETFTTPNGLQCTITSGMCSPFSPRGHVKLSCEDGRDARAQFPCPKPLQKHLLNQTVPSSLNSSNPLPTQTLRRSKTPKRRRKRRYTPKHNR